MMVAQHLLGPRHSRIPEALLLRFILHHFFPLEGRKDIISRLVKELVNRIAACDCTHARVGEGPQPPYDRPVLMCG